MLSFQDPGRGRDILRPAAGAGTDISLVLLHLLLLDMAGQQFFRLEAQSQLAADVAGFAQLVPKIVAFHNALRMKLVCEYDASAVPGVELLRRRKLPFRADFIRGRAKADDGIPDGKRQRAVTARRDGTCAVLRLRDVRVAGRQRGRVGLWKRRVQRRIIIDRCVDKRQIGVGGQCRAPVLLKQPNELFDCVEYDDMDKIMGTSKVRLGVIGIGNMGTEHCRNILAGKCPEIELAAVVFF